MQDRKILLTGASKGIGKATALHLAYKKASLILVARNESELKILSEECKGLGSEVHYFVADLSTVKNGTEFAKQITNQFSDITDIVLNAGISTSKRFENNSLEDMEFELGVNYLSPVAMIKEFIPYFKEKKYGNIVCVSSFSALTPFPGNSSYAATKSAIFSLCNSLKIELNEYNIHVGCVLPGGTKTDMTKEFDSISYLLDDPKLIAGCIEDLLNRKESVIVPGLLYNSAALLYKIFPQPINRFLEFTVKNIFPNFNK
jgi:uncharacterized protein